MLWVRLPRVALDRSSSAEPVVKEQIEDLVAGKASKGTSQGNLPPIPSGGAVASPPPVVVNQVMSDRQFGELTANVSTLRQELLTSLGMDSRRNLNADCGYPDNPTTERFFRLYQRNPYARRACEVFPREAFKSRLTVRETRDPCSENDEEDTDFDKAVDELGSSARGMRSWFKDKDGSIVHEIMMRAAIQAGIGQYAVILLGLNDGLPLDQPVAGVEEQWSMPSKQEQDPTDPESGDAKAGSSALSQEVPKPKGVYNLRVTDDVNRCFVVNAEGEVEAVDGERKLIYLRTFGELSAPVTSWELNRTSPRFNQPVYYQITFNSPWDSGRSVGQPMTTQNVHWTRVVHIPGRDIQGGTELTSTSELEPIINPCLNLDKILGASGEGYWKSCFTGLSIETHPTLGTSVKVDKSNIRSQLENYDNSLTRTLFLMGVQAKTIAPSVTDPAPHIASNIEAICIQKGIPKRKFMGSERGELASSQDEGDWNDQIKIYHRTYANPRVVVPLYDRFIMVGILPEPESYGVEWEDLSSLTALEKAQVAVQMTTALGQAIAAGVVPTFFSDEDYLVVVCGYDRTLVKEVLSNAQDAKLEQQSQMDDLADEHGFAPAPPPGMIDPEQQDYENQVAMEQAKSGGGGQLDPLTGEPKDPPIGNVENCGGPGSGRPGPCPKMSARIQEAASVGASGTEKANGYHVRTDAFAGNEVLGSQELQRINDLDEDSYRAGHEEVDYDELVFTQGVLERDKLKEIAEAPEFKDDRPVRVFEDEDGTRYLQDGHHRTVAAMLRERGTVPAFIYKHRGE